MIRPYDNLRSKLVCFTPDNKHFDADLQNWAS
jgi:hypothetical protein